LVFILWPRQRSHAYSHAMYGRGTPALCAMIALYTTPLARASMAAPHPGVKRFGAQQRQQRHPAVVCEEDVFITTSPLAEGEKKRVIEFCRLGSGGAIEECAIMEVEELEALMGSERAQKMLTEQTDTDLFFAPAAGGDEEDMLLTAADWQICLDDDVCGMPPDDALLRALGPDAFLEMKKQYDDDAVDEKPRFHLHFGAGRLGMGLVVPAISASGIPFGIVQRPKRKWSDLFYREGRVSDAGQIEVSNNNAIVVHRVEIITKPADNAPPLLPPQSLIFGSTTEDLGDIVARATSFSCSLGSAMPAVLKPLLTALPKVRREEQPVLFCCENDHAAVDKLAKALAGHIHVVDCMVDRVCTGRTISSEGVDVAAEPWRGSIVVLDPDFHGRLPFHSSVATVPSNALEAHYLSERKLSLVNGMHTMLAFMTLNKLFTENDGGREYVLLKYAKVPREAQRMVEAWRTARTAQLIDTFGVDNLMAWHGCGSREEVWEMLLSHADHILVERFSQTDDVVSRVLGGGVANRWLTRLRPTYGWLSRLLLSNGTSGDAVSDKGGGSLSTELREFFQYAVDRDRQRALERGCTLEDIEWRGCEVEGECTLEGGCDPAQLVFSYLESLTRSSQRFCSREREITHKELIKQQRKAGGKANAPKVQEAKALQQGRGI